MAAASAGFKLSADVAGVTAAIGVTGAAVGLAPNEKGLFVSAAAGVVVAAVGVATVGAAVAGFRPKLNAAALGVSLEADVGVVDTAPGLTAPQDAHLLNESAF